jgi:predicted dehydrogenase
MRVRREGRTEVTDFPHVDHFAGQVAYFSDCILSGREPEPDGEEGLADMVGLLAIEQAAATGRPVAISLPPRPRHPTPDMERRLPLTDRRLLL